MHLSDLFRAGRPVFSIELFPPKTAAGMENLTRRLQALPALAPDYVSVTYGAGGGTRHNTMAVCTTLLDLGLEVMAHLTCVSHTREEIGERLAELGAVGIDKIMALRGDPPRGETAFKPPAGGFRYAAQLVAAIKATAGFAVGVAGYPEGHAEAPGYEVDLARQIEKIQTGADVVVSQFFLHNDRFLRWRDDLRRAGVAAPIEAGVLPALSATQIEGFAATCGVAVPPALLAGLEKLKDDKEGAAAFGLDFALRQIEGLLAEGVDGIHLYALNRLAPVRAVAPLVLGK